MTDCFADGGGSSVISQLIIVNEIMHRIRWILKLESVPCPYEYAELMVGSGMGAYAIESPNRYNLLIMCLCYRVVVILLTHLRLTAQQTLIHIAKLGQAVFLQPNESVNSHQFDVERLKTSTLDILRQYGFTDTSKMVQDALSTGQTYA
jgi:TctA family transporter